MDYREGLSSTSEKWDEGPICLRPQLIWQDYNVPREHVAFNTCKPGHSLTPVSPEAVCSDHPLTLEGILSVTGEPCQYKEDKFVLRTPIPYFPSPPPTYLLEIITQLQTLLSLPSPGLPGLYPALPGPAWRLTDLTATKGRWRKITSLQFDTV